MLDHMKLWEEKESELDQQVGDRIFGFSQCFIIVGLTVDIL